MELRDYFRLLYKYSVLLILTVFIFAGVGFFVSLRLPSSYAASSIVYVRRKVTPPSAEYFNFEGYYGQQTSKEYTDTVVGFFKSRDLMKQSLESLGSSPSVEELKVVSGTVRIKKLSPRLISVSIVRSDAEEDERILSALVGTVSEKVIELNKDGGDDALSLATIDSNPMVEEIKPRPKLNAAVSAAVGLLLILILITFREYLKEESVQVSKKGSKTF